MSVSSDILLQCLMEVARLHSLAVHPEALVSGLPLENGLLTPSIFNRAAKRAGLNSKIVHKPISELNSALYPAVLLLNNNQACVLLSINNEQQAEVIFPDLPDAKTQLSLAELNEAYSGYCIYVRPTTVATQRSDDPFDTARKGHWFWSVIKQNSGLYRDIIFAAIVINFFAVAMPMYVMNVYDRVVPNSAFATLWVLSIGMFVLLASDLLLKLLRSWFIDLAASRTDIRLSSRLLEQVLAVRLEFKPMSSGNLASYMQSFESVRSFVSSLTLTALADLPFLLLFIVIVTLISWPLVVPIIIGSAAILFYAWLNHRRMQTLSDDNMKISTLRTTLLLDGLANLETIKSFNIQGNMQSRWEQLTIEITNNAAKMRLLSASVTQGAAWIQQTVGIAIIITGVYLVSQGDLTQGGLIAAYLLSSRALAPVSQAAGLMSQFHNASTAMEALEKLMELPTEHLDADKKLNRPILQGNIEFQNVNFAYPNHDVLALNQINLKIKQGERVAIIGKNGSGKSSLEKMVLGLYSPRDGRVLIDGIDLQQHDLTQLRKNIGYVPQDVSFLTDSLKQNITNGGHFSDEHVINIAAQVGLLPMIQQHPDGIMMPVGERGQQLSGGQRQALAIARALINNPSILILDEPTASLDHFSEEQIKNLLAKLAENKTLILVTHRSPLLALADRLIVMDQGKIIADGPKDKVMEALREGKIKGAS